MALINMSITGQRRRNRQIRRRVNLQKGKLFDIGRTKGISNLAMLPRKELECIGT